MEGGMMYKPSLHKETHRCCHQGFYKQLPPVVQTFLPINEEKMNRRPLTAEDLTADRNSCGPVPCGKRAEGASVGIIQ